MTFNLAAVLLAYILGSRPHEGFAAAGGFAGGSRSRGGFVWSEEQIGRARAGKGSVKGKALRPAWHPGTILESQALVRGGTCCSDPSDCVAGDLYLPDCRGWCGPSGRDPARRRSGHLGECGCAGKGSNSVLCPSSYRGCFSVTEAGFWGSFFQLLSLLGEHLILVVLSLPVTGGGCS